MEPQLRLSEKGLNDDIMRAGGARRRKVARAPEWAVGRRLSRR